MELRDFSDLRTSGTTLTDHSGMRTGEDRLRIPLNGQEYWAMAEPPAELILSAMGQVGGGEDLAAELAKLTSGSGVGTETLEQLAQTNPVLMMKVASAGMTQTERSIAFLQAVLLPESARRWAYFMKAPPLETACDADDPRRVPGIEPPVRPTTDDEQAEHRRYMITLRQCMAVYQDLIRAYGGRPTVPPSSSESGHGGTGGTSTAGAPAEVSTP